MTRVIQVLVPCTDDFIGPFANEGHAATWAQMVGLQPGEFVAHEMVDPANVRASQQHWSKRADGREQQVMLVLSTAHLSQSTAANFSACCAWTHFEKGEYGWFVYVPVDAADTEGPDVPLELRSAMHVARTHGYQWVMYDRDGPEMEELPTYEW